MALTAAAVAKSLTALTGELLPHPGVADADLERARLLLAQAMVTGQPEPLGDEPVPGGTVPPSVRREIEAIAATAVATPSAEATTHRVLLRSWRTWPHQDGSPAWAAGRMPDESLGPFDDDAGGRVVLDVFHRAPSVAMMVHGTADPIALLPPLESTAAPTLHRIGAGTVWLRARSLAADAPDGWCGVQVDGGWLTLDAPAEVRDDVLAVFGGGDLTVDIPASVPPVASAPGVGADAAAADVTLPTTLGLRLAGATLVVTEVGPARLTCLGATVDLIRTGGAPRSVPGLGSVVVPMTPTATAAPLAGSSSLLRVTGEAQLDDGGWALPVTPPSAVLGRADGAGQALVSFRAGARATAVHLPGAVVALGALHLLASPGRLGLVAPSATAPRLAASRVELWAPEATGGRGGRVGLGPPGAPFDVRLLEVAGRSELLLATVSATAALDRPLRSDGRPYDLPSPAARLAVHLDDVGRSLHLDGAVPVTRVGPDGVDRPTSPRAVALANALLRTATPRRLRVVGRWDDADPMTVGAAGIDLPVYRLLPILPHPYAANVDLAPLDEPSDVTRAQVVVTVRWRGTAEGSVRVQANRVSGSLERALLPATSPSPRRPIQASPAVRAVLDEDELREDRLRSLFTRAVGTVTPRTLLLDLSGAADRFGVGIGLPPDRFGADRLDIVDGHVVAPLTGLRSFTLPAVQWEPVHTDPDPALPFPSPAEAADDGGPTVLGAATVHLVPVAPHPVLDAIVATAGDPSAHAAVWTTLPFGIRAVAFPHRAPDPTEPGGSMAHVRPTFAGPGTTRRLEGARQVRLTPVPPDGAAPTTGSPSLPGATVQLRNLVRPGSGAPYGLSVLGDGAANAAESIFTAELMPGGIAARVPVERLDLSGYGTSLFSDWRGAQDSPVGIDQVRFDVLVGRTAHEVVQVRSLLYPYGVPVVRTIVIRRTATGAVRRRDSGWQAAGDGLWRFPGPPLTVHPGVVHGAFRVRRIRDTPHVVSSGGARVTAVRFDADLQLEGAVLGQDEVGRVPVTDHLGYVLLPPVGATTQVQPLTPHQLAGILASEGPPGGAVDAVLDVGGSGQRLRVTRVELATAPVAGAHPAFAAVVRGALVLPTAGQWFTTVRPTDGSEPGPLDPAHGLPLVRRGPAGAPAATTSPYRFAEAADLLAAQPGTEYGLLAGTDSQRVLFPHPEIRRGEPAITSSARPLLADMYTLAAGVGLFPCDADAVEVPTTDHVLEVIDGGGLRLHLPFDRFPVTRPPRDLLDTPAVRTYVEYADEHGHPTRAEVRYDSNADEPLEIHLDPISVVNDITPFDGLVRLRGAIRSRSRTGTELERPKVVFGSVMAPVQEIITVLQDIGFPTPFAVSMTNTATGPHRSYKLKVAFERALERKFEPLLLGSPPPDKKIKGYIETGIGRIKGELAVGLEVSVPYDPLHGRPAARHLPPGAGSPPGPGAQSPGPPSGTATATATFFAEISADMLTPIIPPVLYAGGHFALGIETELAGTQPAQITLTAAGTGMVGGDLLSGFVSLSATVRRGYVLVITGDEVRPGLMLGLEGEAEILGGDIVGIGFSVEAQGVVERVDTEHIELSAEFTVAADLAVAHFVRTSVEIETEYRETIPTLAVAALGIAMGYPTYP